MPGPDGEPAEGFVAAGAARLITADCNGYGPAGKAHFGLQSQE